jgi:HEAT repeat protein
MRSRSRGLSALLFVLVVTAAARAEPVRDGLPLSAWQGFLQNPDVGSRRVAAEKLGLLGPEAAPAVPALVAALADPDDDVRARAADALARVGGPAVWPLRRALADPRPQVRRGAATALGRNPGDPERSAAALAPLLSDPEPAVRLAALSALCSLGRAPDGAGAVLAGVLEGGDDALRRQALEVLPNLGPAARPALPAVRKLLKVEEKPEGRPLAADAADALARLGPDAREAAPELKALLEHREEPRPGNDTRAAPHRETRVAAAVALLAAGEHADAAYDALADALDFRAHRQYSGDGPVPPEEARHRRALNGLVHGAKAVRLTAPAPGPFNAPARAALLRALAGKDEHVRAGAAQALSLFTEVPDDVAVVLRRVADEEVSGEVRLFALVALSRRPKALGRDDVDELLAGLGRRGGLSPVSGRAGRMWCFDWREGVVASAVRVGGDAVPRLQERLTNGDRFTREGAAEALYRLGPAARPALPALRLRAEKDKPFFGGKTERDGSWAGVWCALALAELGAGPREVLPALALGRTKIDERARNRRHDGEGNGDEAALCRLDAALSRGLWPCGAAAVPALLDDLEDVGPAALARSLLTEPAPAPLADALLDGLVAALSAAEPQRRAAAAALLGAAGPRLSRREGAARALLRALDDPDADVRAEAAVALWRLRAAPAERVRPVLLAVAEAEHLAPHRLEALLQVGVPPEEAPRLLEQAAKRPGSSALVAYYRAAPDAVGPLLDLLGHPEEDHQTLAVLTLSGFGPAAVPGLARQLGDANPAARRHAALVLERLGPAAASAAPSLRELLRDPDPTVRVRAALGVRSVLLQSNDDDARVLLEALAGRDVGLRRLAAAALTDNVRRPEVRAALLRALDDDSPEVRVAAVNAFGHLGKDGADELPLLLERAADPDVNVRRAAVVAAGQVSKALPETQPETARRLLALLVAERDRTTRRQALHALNRLDPERVADLVLPRMVPAFVQKKDEDLRDLAEDYLAGSGPRAVPYLIPLVSAAGVDTDTRVQVLDILSEAGPEVKAALPALAQALRHPDPVVRGAAVRCAARCEADGVPLLVEALAAPDRDTRLLAARYLPGLGAAARPALPRLLELAGSRDTEARVIAFNAVQQIQADDPAVLATMVKALRDEDPDLRRMAVEGLTMAGKDGLPALRAAAASPDAQVRRTALLSLGAQKSPEHAALLARALEDGNDAVRLIALQRLPAQGELAAPAVPGLVKALGDPNPALRTTAAQALAAIGPPAKEAVPALRQLRRDRDEGVRRAVAAALERIGAE